MTHVLCVHLKQWPIDRLQRRRPELRHKRLVLVETIRNRQVIAHANPQVPPAIHPGMVLAEAKARCSELIHLPVTQADDLRTLESLGRWLIRFSPNVNVSPPDTIFLDATGLEKLFGGLHNLRSRVVETLVSLQISATVTIAPTAGAAWAIAAYGRNQPRIISQQQIADVVSPLPPAALRLSNSTLRQLQSLGILTIGSLLRLNRSDLATRFGHEILQKIDYATGAKPEPMVFLKHRGAIRARLEFGGAIDSLEVIYLAIKHLAAEVANQLAPTGLGAKEVRLSFRTTSSQSTEKTVQFIRPTRTASAIFDLLRCAVEKIKTHRGIVAATLLVTSTETLRDEQSVLMGETTNESRDFEHLIERLRARFDGVIQWGELVESNVPEQVSQFTDTVTASNPHVLQRNVGIHRPLCLLPEPRPIKVIVRPSDSREGEPVSFTDRDEVHRLAHVRGPEKITGQWWKGRWKTRDYFDALDLSGNRYWLFRVAQTGRWFLHGVFD